MLGTDYAVSRLNSLVILGENREENIVPALVFVSQQWALGNAALVEVNLVSHTREPSTQEAEVGELL